jgi:hypothetical protein
MKKCTKCSVEKLLNDFPKCSSGTKDGLASWCRICHNEKNKLWREKNKEYVKEVNNKNYNNNRILYIEQVKKYNEKNNDKILDYRKKYNEKNKAKAKEYNKIYVSQNKNKILESSKKYRIKYPHVQRWRNILRNTLEKLNQIKSSSTYTLLKYTPQELKEHLDNLGMDWDKHHIDHKIPITWFKPETPPHIVNDLRNLHPLEESINKSKNNRYNHIVDEDYLHIVKEWIKEEYNVNLDF